MSRRYFWPAFVTVFVLASSLYSADLKPPLEAPAGFEHDKWGTQPEDIVRTITAFKVSFDSADDDAPP